MEEDIIEIKRQSVVSANIKSLGYNDERSIMALEMLDEKVFYYLDIPKYHFTAMINCESIGSYLNRNIKGNYRYIRVK